MDRFATAARFDQYATPQSLRKCLGIEVGADGAAALQFLDRFAIASHLIQNAVFQSPRSLGALGDRALPVGITDADSD